MWVTNNSGHDLEDGYDGQRYKFPSGKSVEVPAVVCRHVFGFADDDKSSYLIRLGWIEKSNDFDSAIKRLAEFSFSSEKPEPISHSLSPVVDTEAVAFPKKKAAASVRLVA